VGVARDYINGLLSLVMLKLGRGANRNRGLPQFTYWDYAHKRIETRAQSRSVMLLKCSGQHAHHTDSDNELLEGASAPSQPGPKGLGNLLRLSRDGDCTL